MVKRFVFIFVAFILCGTVSIAQNKHAEYEKLVDYVNCYYAEKYISSKIADIKEDAHRKDFEKYKNAFKSSVKSYSDISIGIDKTVPNSTSVYNALKKFVTYYPKTQALWQYIDNKKRKFNENWTKAEMIDFLILLSDDEIKISGRKVNFKTFLNKATTMLKKDLQKQIPDNFFITNNVPVKKEEIKEDIITEIPETDIVREKSSYDKTDILTGIKINKNSRIKLKVDTVYSLYFTINPETYTPKIIEWKTDKEDVVKITDKNNANCKIEFLKEGKAKITVVVDGKQDTETFKVGGNSWLGSLLKWLIVVVIVCFVFKFREQLWKFIKAIIAFFKKEKNVTQVEEETKTTEPKPEETKKLTSAEVLQVLKFVLSKDEYFTRFILKNEQLCLLWVKNSLKYPEIREMLEKELFPKENSKQPVIAEKTFKQEEKVVVIPEKEKTTETSAFVFYADAIIDGFFNHVKETPNENTIFELRLKNMQTANFTVHTAAYKRVIANPSFLEGCEKQVLDNAQNVRIESEGTAQQQADGKWKVIKKLNIIIN